MANDVVFLFDHSSGHCAYAEDALLAHKMNVSDGGKQPFYVIPFGMAGTEDGKKGNENSVRGAWYQCHKDDIT